jgi:uncharacterized membrane protein YgcG
MKSQSTRTAGVLSAAVAAVAVALVAAMYVLLGHGAAPAKPGTVQLVAPSAQQAAAPAVVKKTKAVTHKKAKKHAVKPTSTAVGSKATVKSSTAKAATVNDAPSDPPTVAPDGTADVDSSGNGNGGGGGGGGNGGGGPVTYGNQSPPPGN